MLSLKMAYSSAFFFIQMSVTKDLKPANRENLIDVFYRDL